MFFHVFIFLVGTVLILVLSQTCNLLQDPLPVLSENGLALLIFLILTVLCWMRDISVLARVSFLAWICCFVVIAAVVLNLFLEMNARDHGQGGVVKFVNLPTLRTPGMKMLGGAAASRDQDKNPVTSKAREILLSVAADSSPLTSKNPTVASVTSLFKSYYYSVTMNPQKQPGGDEPYLDFPKWVKFRACRLITNSCLIDQNGQILFQSLVSGGVAEGEMTVGGGRTLASLLDVYLVTPWTSGDTLVETIDAHLKEFIPTNIADNDLLNSLSPLRKAITTKTFVQSDSVYRDEVCEVRAASEVTDQTVVGLEGAILPRPVVVEYIRFKSPKELCEDNFDFQTLKTVGFQYRMDATTARELGTPTHFGQPSRQLLPTETLSIREITDVAAIVPHDNDVVGLEVSEGLSGCLFESNDSANNAHREQLYIAIRQGSEQDWCTTPSLAKIVLSGTSAEEYRFGVVQRSKLRVAKDSEGGAKDHAPLLSPLSLGKILIATTTSKPLTGLPKVRAMLDWVIENTNTVFTIFKSWGKKHDIREQLHQEKCR